MKLRELKCPSCFAPLKLAAASDVVVCEYCGTALTVERPADAPRADAPRADALPADAPTRQAPRPSAPPPLLPSVPAPPPAPARDVPQKSRTLTAVLAFVLGVFGVHHFYLGNKKLGLVYLAFFWTYFPAMLGWLEGLSCLFMSDDAWYNRRSGFIVNKKGTIAFVIMMAVLYLIGTYA